MASHPTLPYGCLSWAAARGGVTNRGGWITVGLGGLRRIGPYRMWAIRSITCMGLMGAGAVPALAVVVLVAMSRWAARAAVAARVAAAFAWRQNCLPSVRHLSRM